MCLKPGVCRGSCVQALGEVRMFCDSCCGGGEQREPEETSARNDCSSVLPGSACRRKVLCYPMSPRHLAA